MKPYQRQFIEFALGKQVLKFGEFTLKSGRKSPYFFNAGLFNTGRDLALLGRFYAEALVDSGLEFDLLFGPAYKGIPIATTTAVALAEHHDLDLPYCFNRKEAKDHGEGGNLVGSALQGRVMLVDDVITAGTAIRESMEIIQANGATLAGVLISLDRQERGRGEISAIQEVERDYNCKVISIITLKDLIAYLEEKPEMAVLCIPKEAAPRLVEVLVVPMGPEQMPQALSAAQKLRQADIKTDVYYQQKGMKQKMKYAGKLGIPYVMLIGEEEAANQQVTLKNMNQGQQATMVIEEAIAQIH